jgi:fatty-acyl-CoA synthase
MFATWSAGAIFVPLNMRLAGPELAYQLADCGAALLVYTPEQAAVVAGIRGVGGRGPAGRGPGLRYLVALARPAAGDHDYERLLAGPPTEPVDLPVSLDDPGLIMYTSGTTGRAKGATLTHGNITWNAINVVVDADFRADEVALVVAPLFHTAALNMLCLPTMLKGGSVLIETAFEPARVLELIARYRVTSMFGVPAIYDAIAAVPGWADADTSSLRMLLCGGAPVPDATIRRYTSRGLTFIQGYGMTETSPGALLLDAEHALAKAGSAGVPHFFTDVRVVGPDGAQAGPGERGEIIVAGPNVMPGYWGQPDASAAVLADGWLHSGDVGTADEDGYVSVVDRIKDVIISGGENISSLEVEDILYRHPAVLAAAVVAMPDEKWGETPCAFIELKKDSKTSEKEIIDFCRGQMAKFKAPRAVVFGELPKTSTGKIQKFMLREKAKSASAIDT